MRNLILKETDVFLIDSKEWADIRLDINLMFARIIGSLYFGL